MGTFGAVFFLCLSVTHVAMLRPNASSSFAFKCTEVQSSVACCCVFVLLMFVEMQSSVGFILWLSLGHQLSSGCRSELTLFGVWIYFLWLMLCWVNMTSTHVGVMLSGVIRFFYSSCRLNYLWSSLHYWKIFKHLLTLFSNIVIFLLINFFQLCFLSQ